MQTTTEVAERLDEGKTFGLGVLLPFQTFRPMLANPWSTVDKFPVSVEAKYDGIRLILHKLGDRVGWFTRNRNDYSRILEELVPLGQSFKPYSCILDCELIGLESTERGIRHASVYEIMDDFSKEDKRFFYSIVVFDVLFLNGHDTTTLPFHHRRNLRNQICRMMNNVPSSIVVKEADFQDAFSPSDISGAYQRFHAAGYEGAIVKNLNAPYYIGLRTSVWRKLIPREHYDTVITGVALDERAGGQQIHGFRCAVRDNEVLMNMSYVSGLDAPTGQRLMQMIVDGGLIAEGTEIQSLDYGYSDRFGKSTASRHWGFPIHPAIVVTVDVQGIVAHSDGRLTFRSPRFIRIHETKPPEEISTYADVQRAFEVQSS
jgi:ATP-dependent DNA ligase